jgi:CheY-like chemotaxis protein
MSAKTHVLVVDDEAAILRFLKPALEANGYEMTSAGSVAEATKRIAADSPDIVLLDLGLPDGDGKDVIRRAREWSDVPIIVLSAREREAEKIEALDLGADDYVNKPSMLANSWHGCGLHCAIACSERPKSRYCALAILKSMPYATAQPARAQNSS